MTETIKIVFSDLDGTLLSPDKTMSKANILCLEKLGRRRITRVFATGRSLFSFNKLDLKKPPADYLIFSTGAGVLDLKKKLFLQQFSHTKTDIEKITRLLLSCNVDFMVHHRVPENHNFLFHGNLRNNSDFAKRIKIYGEYAHPLTSLQALPNRSAQIICIFKEYDLSKFEEIAMSLNNYQVTRTTSPLDHQSIWMEIFPAGVSKGNSAAWLCNHLQIGRDHTFAIGNDYNDLSMLEFSRYSYVVENAPKSMRDRYKGTTSCNKDGFAKALAPFIR